MITNYFDLLFRPGEKACFSDDIYGTTPYPIEDRELRMWEYIALNPLKGSRCDANVTARRNILVEFDKMPLADQQPHVDKVGLPYSTCVYSGGKSYHYVLSLATDSLTHEQYSLLVKRIYKAVGNDLVDQNCKNPSRFTRQPEAFRRDKGRNQTLVAVRSAIDLPELEKWLLSRSVGPMAAPIKKPALPVDRTSPTWFTDLFLNRKTRDFLSKGAEEGDRHRNVVNAALDFCRVGKPIEEAQERILEASGLDLEGRNREVENTINWCYSKCER